MHITQPFTRSEAVRKTFYKCISILHPKNFIVNYTFTNFKYNTFLQKLRKTCTLLTKDINHHINRNNKNSTLWIKLRLHHTHKFTCNLKLYVFFYKILITYSFPYFAHPLTRSESFRKSF